MPLSEEVLLPFVKHTFGASQPAKVGSSPVAGNLPVIGEEKGSQTRAIRRSADVIENASR